MKFHEFFLFHGVVAAAVATFLAGKVLHPYQFKNSLMSKMKIKGKT